MQMPESKGKCKFIFNSVLLTLYEYIFCAKIIKKYFQDRSCYWDISNGYSRKLGIEQRQTINQDMIKPENFECKTPNHRLKCREKPATCSQGNI